MSHPVNFGQLIVLNSSFCCYTTAKKCKKTILHLQQKIMAWGKVGRYVKKKIRILKDVAHLFIQ
jgi:hypothetical protein